MSEFQFRARTRVFDANIYVGVDHRASSICRTRIDLLTELDRFEIERAVVTHILAESVSPIDGNRLLHEWIGEDGRLIPLWSAMPTPDSLAQLREIRAARQCSGVRLYETGPIGLPFRRWAYEPLLGWLIEAGIPLWITLPDADPHALVSTLQEYPDLVTVLTGAHYAHALWIRPILRAIPNAHLELSRYEPLGEIEALRSEFGAERLLYGSWFPKYAMGPVLFYLHQTDFSDKELHMVCSGNLERILQGAER